MKIEERFTVPFPPARVWAFLHDTEAVVRCLPGAEPTETGADGRLAGRFSVRLGPIAATFTGNAELTFDEAAQKGQITGTGSDRQNGSRARGSLSFALTEESGGTRIDLALDYTLAGALAQFNRGGIVRDLAARLTGQLAANLEAAIAADKPPAPVDALDAGGLFARVLWIRLRDWLWRLFGRG